MIRSIATLVSLLVAVSAAAQDTTGVGVIRGSVVGTDGPAEDVAVCLTETAQCAVSGSDGAFAIEGVRAATYQLEIIAPPLPLFLSQEVEVRPGLESVVVIALPALASVQESVTVTAPAFVFPAEVRNSGFLVSEDEVSQSAGALQDVARYVQSLPGVVIGANDFRNDLIVRGGSPLENLYVVDNIEIPNINTFATFASAGGTVSLIDSALIQDVTFLTGGYSAAYGNRTSSVLQVTQREGDRSRARGRATLGFAGAGAIVEGPIGSTERGSWIVSARRSFLDLFTDDIGIGGVPVLYTFNGKAVYDITPRDRVWLVNISGVDNLRLGLTDTSDLSEELSTLDITYDGSRSASGFNWQRLLGTEAVGLLGVTYSRASVNQRVKDLLFRGVPPPGLSVAEQIEAGETVFSEASTEAAVTVKYDLTAEVPRLGRVQVGGSARRVDVRYDTESPLGRDNPFFSIPDVNPFALTEAITTYQASGYLQASRDITRRLSATLGARVDRYEYLETTAVSPRFGVDFDLTDRLSARVSYGRYFQPPFLLFLAAFPENRTLGPIRADHYVGGLAYQHDTATRFTVELYRKQYRDYPVSSQIASLSLANIGDTFDVGDVLFPMVGVGRGQADGVEIFAERKPGSGRWYGQTNLAFSRVRHAGLDGILRPGSFDYPVVANVVGGVRVSPRWDASVRVAYLAGRPFTPFDAELSRAQRRAVYDVSQVNAERAPDYFRLDVRLDYRLELWGRSVTVFGEVQNLTNRRNVSGFGWDRRNNTSRVNEQLGVFPILGFDWEF